MAVEAIFLPSANGQRFAVLNRPDHSRRARGCVVFVHAFAEEMNKSRRMAALQARALAASGYAVLQVDLFGCGDSTGHFADATWEVWVADVASACNWLHEETGVPLWLWGHRSGALLAVEAARRLSVSVGFIFWQPVLSGSLFLQQFLRLKVASDMLVGAGKVRTEGLRHQLATGESVEIGGYRMSPELAVGLEHAELAPPLEPARVKWLELSSRSDATVGHATRTAIERWEREGHRVRHDSIVGPAFWQTVEITEVPALIGATTTALLDPAP
jgi:exosortase A-associated hydrolase 2